MEQISIRNVSNEQIYDSYMGILRISPNLIEGQQIDDTTLLFSNPKDGDADRKIILSDSDGNELGAYFTSKVQKKSVIVDKDGNREEKDVINVAFNVDDTAYVVKNYSIRSTLIVNDKNTNVDSRIMPILVFSKNTNRAIGDTYNVISYPIESPHDDSYFNSLNKKSLIDYNSSVPVYEQLETALYNKPKSWYDANITNNDVVQIDGKVAYTYNKDYESVPIVYTNDYVLGSYSGHTIANIDDDIVSKFIGNSDENNKLTLGSGESVYTRLSYIPLDKIIWSFINELLSGELRHYDGRYQNLGIGQNESLTMELFGKANVDDEIKSNAPIIGTSTTQGTIVYHAMPFRRFAFHLLRQELRNKTDDNNISGSLKTYATAGKITAIPKKTPGFINMLSKEYILCDGKEINYSNYPSMNTENSSLFKVDEKGITIRNNNKPVENTDWQNNVNVYSAIKNSNLVDGKLKTPHLLALDQTAMRFIRGINWIEKNKKGVNSPISFDEDIIEYVNNDYPIQIVENSDWGKTKKNISQTGNYRTNIDFKLSKTKHCHYLFYKSASANQTAIVKNNPDGETNDVNKLPYASGQTQFSNFGIVGNSTSIAVKSPVNYQDSEPYRPFFWNSDATTTSVSYKTGTAIGGSETSGGAMHSALDGVAQVRYSFKKHAVNDNGTHLMNNIASHTPVPSAGLFAWKVTKDDKTFNAGQGAATTQNTVAYELANNKYVIQNEAETLISNDKNVRYYQLNQMNKAEGLAPIAYKGGTENAKTYSMTVSSESRSTGDLGTRARYKATFQAYTGAYEIKRDSGGVITTDVPRCVTSLPIIDIMNEINNPSQEIEKVTTGNGNVNVITDLSQPPSINMLPLFKI